MADELLSRLFLTALPGFRLDRVLVEDAIVVTASSVQQESPCPLCGTLSSRVHSQYSRHLADLPSGHRSVVLDLAVRRFVCAEPQCSRRIFCERFVDGPSPYARRTGRACRVVQHLSVILGGNAGAQLALKLSLPVSASSVLRSAQALTVTPAQVPEVIGVDDFALRRGQVYGTVIVDLAQGKAIELLPDRSAETLAAWLQQHPHIKVISRDPRAEYEKGVRLGAPNAQQVLDRWHVIKNFREALERQLGRDRKTILDVCRAEVPVPPMPRTQSEELRYEAGQQARQEFFEQVQALSKAGYSQLAITQRLRVSRGRVRQYLTAQAPPERRHHLRRPSILDPFVPYLEDRWAAGEDNAAALFRELREQGYPGSRKRVAQWVQVRRTHPARTTPGPYQATAVKQHHVPVQEQAPLLSGQADRNLTLRRLVWLLLPGETTLDPSNRELLTTLTALHKHSCT